MVGEPIEEVQNGMRTIIQELRTDPYALETVFVSIIAFAGRATTLSPLAELYKFYPPTFPIGGGTSLATGLTQLMDSIDRDVQKTTMETKGDWKPIIFLFTDGTPTDDCSAAFQRWNQHYRRHCNLIAISIGENLDTSLLGKITENVLLLKNTDKEGFRQFFKWVTASIKTTSVSVSEQNTDELHLPATTGINLEKVNPKESKTIDENFAVLLGKCQNTNKTYLIKFARKFGTLNDLECMVRNGYRLAGTYPIDEKQYDQLSDKKYVYRNINTNQLYGRPTCPCCGNQLGFVLCECGKIFCAGEDGHARCPWCGLEGELTSGGEEGLNVNRTQG